MKREQQYPEIDLIKCNHCGGCGYPVDAYDDPFKCKICAGTGYVEIMILPMGPKAKAKA
jgi:RecJ-like exonuclease